MALKPAMLLLLLAWLAALAPPSSAPAVVTTHSPLIEWQPSARLNASLPFAFRITVTAATGGTTRTPQWDSGWTWRTPAPASGAPPETIAGRAVLEGPPLEPGSSYAWVVGEKQAGWSVPSVARGRFKTSKSLPSAKAAAIAAVNETTAFFAGTATSMMRRINTSTGEMPTSVGLRYSGQYSRDTSAMLLGLIELGVARKDSSDAAGAAEVLGKAKLVLGAMLDAFAPFDYIPHIIHNAPSNRQYNLIDETDDTMYVMTAFGRLMNVSADAAFEARHYPSLKRFLNHYVAAGARSNQTGYGVSTHAKPTGGCCADVPYLNTTLGLLVNLNSEHSREMHYWNCYSLLANSLSVEALRYMAVAAERQNDGAQAAQWRAVRKTLLAGIARSLSHPTAPDVAAATGAKTIYAELRARSRSFGAGAVPTVPANPDHLLYGFSWYNLAPVAAFSSSLGYAGRSSTEVSENDELITAAALIRKQIFVQYSFRLSRAYREWLQLVVVSHVKVQKGSAVFCRRADSTRQGWRRRLKRTGKTRRCESFAHVLSARC
jgi:hypothetical protein